MNIGIDARTYQYKTGIGLYVANIIKELNKQDTENQYFLYSPEEADFKFKLNDNFKIRDKIGGKLKFYFRLPKLLKQDNIDVYWGTNYILPKKDKNIKYVLTIHDLAIKKFKTIGSLKTTIVQKLLLKKSIKRADKIIAISKATKEDIIDIYKIPEERIQVIYEGTNFEAKEIEISEKQKEEIENKLGIKDKKFIFFLSTIEPRKNIETLVRAFNYMKRKENIDLKLILSGGLGWNYDTVLELVENSEFKEDIKMTGFISNEEKSYLYKNAECLVYPSLYEGFGLPVLEAMSNKCLVVTANNSSLPEVGGNAAFYYESVLNYGELGNKILEVINLNKEEKEIKINRGLEQVKKFTWDKCAKETLEMLKFERTDK